MQPAPAPRLDSLANLRQAVSGAPQGTLVLEVAVDVAIAHLSGNQEGVVTLLQRFSDPDAARLAVSLKTAFYQVSFPAGTKEQTIMDSPAFLRWQLEWLPCFIRTADTLDSPRPDPIEQWLRTGGFSGQEGQK